MAPASSVGESDLNSQTVFVEEWQLPDDPDPSRATAMTLDELTKGFCSDEPSPPAAPVFAAKLSGPKTVEQVGKEIGLQRTYVGGQEIREMAHDDFLADAGVAGTGAASGEDVAVGGIEGFQNRNAAAAAAAALAEPVDRAEQRRQRRMIKKRAAAARSRERKLAYSTELASTVSQLKEENVKLVQEQMEQKKKRYKQLMENVIPVVEGRRPRRTLRRTSSMDW